MAHQTALLKGELYLRPAAGGPLVSTGNNTKITLSQEVEEKLIPFMKGVGGGNHDKFSRAKSVKLAIAMRELSLQNAKLIFGADVAVLPAAAVADESHVDVKVGGLVPLDRRQDLSMPLVVKKAATTLDEGVDYRRVRAGLIVLANGALADGDDINASYNALASMKVNGLVQTAQEFYGYFDGINERNGKPLVFEFWRPVFGPAKSIELLGDDFLTLDVEADCLADSSRPVGESPFYRGDIAGLFE